MLINFNNTKKRLFNKSEQKAYNEIVSVDCISPSNVFSKVRIADILKIERSGIDSHLYSFALQSHFDFVITNDNFDPLFAIEFNGPTHSNSLQIKRDIKKMEISDFFKFPVLWVNDKYIRKSYRGQMSLLAWIIDVYFLQKDFYNAQEEGMLPLEACFDPMFVWSSIKEENWPYQIGLDSRCNLKNYQKKSLILDSCSNSGIGRHEDGTIRGFNFIRIDKHKCIYVESGMRNSKFPIQLDDLLEELLIISLEKEVSSFLRTGTGFISLQKAREKILQIDTKASWYRTSSVNGLNPISRLGIPNCL